MMNIRTLINTATSLCLVVASSAALADKILLIDESLDTLPAGYLLFADQSNNATANLQIGPVGSSNGLIFDGSWDVPANGSEFALGSMYPQYLSFTEFQVDPRAIEGITSVHWTLDAEVTSTTMAAPEQGIFVQLVIYQLQNDGTILAYNDSGNFVITGQSVSFDITVGDSEFGPLGARPDFSATGLPMSFALNPSATYPREINPQAFFVDGRLTAKNWTVSVTDGGGVFSDSFESQTPALNSVSPQDTAAPVDRENCLCPAPTLPFK